MLTLQERALQAREAGFTNVRLAKAADVSPSAVSHWFSGNTLELKAASALGLAQLTGWNVKWWTDGIGPRDLRSAVAHSLSQGHLNNDSQDDSQRVAWGSMKTADLPEVFQVEVPDDAMADRVLKGHLVKFSRTITPRAGDGVLVEDASGTWFFRQYSPGAQGRFAAVAKNSAYQTLDSERDGLTVLAVLVGVPEARWG